jgi:hypothetical protein
MDQWVLWFLRVIGYGAACASVISKRELWALPILGALLIAEWELHRRAVCEKIIGLTKQFGDLERRAGDAMRFAYLAKPAEVWLKAEEFLHEAEDRDDIWSTASFPNSKDFESAVLQGTFSKKFYYKRLLCYTRAGDEADRGSYFTAFGETDDTVAPEKALALYLTWYDRFFDAWKDAVERDPSGTITKAAMKTWDDALTKLQRHIANVFEVKSFGSEIASDYFILAPHRDHHQAKAVVGFPMTEEGMRGGLAITLPVLAKDLLLNLRRLWDSVPPRPRRIHQEGATVHARP